MEIWVLAGLIAVIAVLRFAPKAAASVPIDGPTLPVDDKPALTVEQIIRKVAEAYGEDAALMLAIAKTETNFNPRAINLSDPSYGLFQIQAFWLTYFGFSKEPEQLYDPEFSANLAARILKYFRGRQNPQTGDYFQFPNEADIYNVGESLWREGRRNLAYRDKVLIFYRNFGGKS
jgi:soluble lytic murein transglycosylase-like protein